MHITIKDTFPPKLLYDGCYGADLFLQYVREKGAERNIKVPKRISCGGCHGYYWWIAYTNNKFRDLVLDCLKDKGFKLMTRKTDE